MQNPNYNEVVKDLLKGMNFVDRERYSKEDFVDDIKNSHYTYEIKNINTNMMYIGVRSCFGDPKKDLGLEYFSSSSNKDFINDQKINRHLYKYTILGIFDTREEAEQHEIFLHAFYVIANNKSFYNRSQVRGWDFSVGVGDNHSRACEIYQIDIASGKIIQEWGNMVEAAKFVGVSPNNISACCNGYQLTAGGYFWHKKDETHLQENIEYLLSKKKEITLGTTRREIYQLDINTFDIIAKWDSIKKASTHTKINPSSIGACCKGRQKTAGGYIWLYVKDYTDEKILSLKNQIFSKKGKNSPHAKPIKQYSIDGAFIKKWDYINEASIALGLNAASIGQCCAGIITTSGGYKWSFNDK